MAEIEHCFECDAPTGRAGRGEDSLYAGDFGPYCPDCWYEAPTKLAEIVLPGQIRAAVQAEHERTKGACAASEEVWTSRLTDALSDNSTVDTYDISVGGIRNLAGIAAREVVAAIRAMPEQGTERGKE